MYAPGPSEAELAAIGLKREDVEDTSIAEIWPENYLAFQIFTRCGTQWNSGMGGPTGWPIFPAHGLVAWFLLGKYCAS